MTPNPSPSIAAVLSGAADDGSRAGIERLMSAARDLLDGMNSTFTSRNGREVGIQADDGEKCYIVHSDFTAELEGALHAVEPIPSGVYFSAEGGNFYAADTRMGMGASFWNTWFDRRADFPTDAARALRQAAADAGEGA